MYNLDQKNFNLLINHIYVDAALRYYINSMEEEMRQNQLTS